MKKVILITLLLLGGMQLAQSQIQFGIKGGINYNSDSFSEVKDDLFSGAKSKTGFHAGIWTRIKLPIIGLYVRPELVYTSLKSELTAKSDANIKATYDFNKLDIPVLLGKKVFGIGNIFVGPSFQYVLSGDFDIINTPSEILNTEANGFTVGVVAGAGVEFGKIGLDLRWERSFSDVESTLITDTGGNVNFDTRVNQIIVGLSYRF